MSLLAIDKWGKSHNANDLNDTYGGPFYCPMCGTEMIRKNRGTEEKYYRRVRPYFSAKRGHPHAENCECSSRSLNYKQLEETGFEAETFFLNLTKEDSQACNKERKPGTRNGNHFENELTTLGKLYAYCCSHDDEEELPDGTKVRGIFQGPRNATLPETKRKSMRMIELELSNVRKEYSHKYGCYSIWCYFNGDSQEKYRLLFTKENEKQFLYYWKKLESEQNRQPGVPLRIVVAGEWHRKGCYITSLRQFYIPLEK